MRFAYRREIRQRTHGPVEVPEIIRVAVAKPIGCVVVGSAARNQTFGGGEVRSVIHGAESVSTGLAVTRSFGIHSIDRGPSSTVAALPRSRTTSTVAIILALLIDCPCAQKGSTSEAQPHPVNQVSDMADPFGINQSRVWPAQDVVGSHIGQELVDVIGSVGNVFKKARPLVPRFTSPIEGILQNPGPRHITSPLIGGRITGLKPDQLIEHPHRGRNVPAILFQGQGYAGAGVEAKWPRSVFIVARPHMMRERVSTALCRC